MVIIRNHIRYMCLSFASTDFFPFIHSFFCLFRSQDSDVTKTQIALSYNIIQSFYLVAQINRECYLRESA